MNHPALFLDRDGVIVLDKGYMSDPADAELVPGIADTIRTAKSLGFACIVVTNQSGIARGFYGIREMEQFHRRMEALLFEAGAPRLDAIYYCPHHPDGNVQPFSIDCQCRKPAPGMVDRACAEFAIDRSRSVLVGDRDTDISCATNAGIRSVFFGDRSRFRGALPPWQFAASCVEIDALLPRILITGS